MARIKSWEGKREWENHLALVLSLKPAKVVQEACQVLEKHGYPVKELKSELYYSSILCHVVFQALHYGNMIVAHAPTAFVHTHTHTHTHTLSPCPWGRWARSVGYCHRGKFGWRVSARHLGRSFISSFHSLTERSLFTRSLHCSGTPLLVPDDRHLINCFWMQWSGILQSCPSLCKRLYLMHACSSG